MSVIYEAFLAQNLDILHFYAEGGHSWTNDIIKTAQ